MNVAVVFAASEAMLAVTVPVDPMLGVDVVHPDGAVNDWKVVLAGVASVSVTPTAVLSLLVTVRV